MSVEDRNEPLSHTELAATLPREDLALMAAACQELSWWERHMMLPMLGSDMPSLRRWLLAEVDDLGMEPEARQRRAAARSSRWRAMARGKECPDERLPKSKESVCASLFAKPPPCQPKWSAKAAQSAWSICRMAAFFTHWGIATGPRADYRYADKDGPAVAQGLAFSVWIIAIIVAINVHKDDPAAAAAAANRAVIYGAEIFAAFRVWLWFAVGPVGRGVFQAQAAQPIWMWGWRQARGAWESLRSGRVARAARPASFEELSAAIGRASLGQPPTAQEQAAAKKILAERERRAASVKAASEPERSLAGREAVDFARMAARARVVKAARVGRL